MHPKNIHREDYQLEQLSETFPPLKAHLQTTVQGSLSIDFSNPSAVYALNKALLLHDYHLEDWELPQGYLCPPVPSRADYIHYIADLLPTPISKPKLLDVGTGANTIYPLLGACVYRWNMIGVDIQQDALAFAERNVTLNPALSPLIELRHQPNPGNILCGILSPEEFVDATLCNPPFYGSQKEADAATKQKNTNLNKNVTTTRNFAGQAKELYCNGGEALFVKRMIKESVLIQDQVGIFTSLIAKSQHLPKLEKQLKKLSAYYRIILMEQGNKKSRILAWSFQKNIR